MNEKTILGNGAVRTLCRMCDTRCSIRVHIQDGVITAITPADGNPVNAGRICPRACAAPDVFYHADRILKPLKRTAAGDFIEIPPEQALNEIAARLSEIKTESGARAVGAWKGEAVGFFQQEDYVRRFIHAFGSPNYFSNDSVCFNGRYLGHALVTGFWNPFPDYSQADLILLFGTNPPVSHPPFMAEFADAKARGARLVVIDPRLNPIACYADIFAQPRPGTDGALAWGIIRLLIEQGEYDHRLVDKFSVGFDKIAAYSRRFTPEHVAALTGVYPDVTVQVARLIVKTRPRVSFYIGTGLEHHDNGVNTIRALAVLACLCGNLDIGCGLTWPEPPALNKLTLYDERDLRDQHPIGADRFPVLYDMRRECHAMTAMDHMLGKGDYRLRALLVTGANPAVANPDTRKVEAALSSLDLLVVNDLFLTPTAKLAHYVLPAATFLERSEIHLNLKHQRIYLTRKVVEIPGVMDDYTLWRELACRLGFGDRYFPWNTEDEVNRHILAPSGIALEELAARPEGILYAPVRYKKHETRPLPTPSGKVEFASAYLKSLGYPEIPEYRPPYHLRHPSADYPMLLTTGARKTLFYLARHQNITRFRKIHPKVEAEMHPEDAAELDIQEGDPIRIISETGDAVAYARIVHRAELLKGVVEIYHGWADWRINCVTNDHVTDPISGFPLLKGVPVRIEKWTANQRPIAVV